MGIKKTEFGTTRDYTIRTEWERIRNILGAMMAREYRICNDSYRGYPVRWVDAYKFRCVDQHVCTIIGFEHEYSLPLCAECGKNAMQTFPEDRSGPIEHVLRLTCL